MKDIEITYENGIRITKGGKTVSLDPRKKSPNPVVSHAHTDHLARDAIMTHATKDIMKARRNWDASASLNYDTVLRIDDFDMLFRDAGHVLGSAMVLVDDVLYTGDFNPEGGLTCGKAKPQKCDKLVVEATYGERRYCLPPKDEVTSDLVAWVGAALEEDSVIIGGYEFGKAQELVALFNHRLKVPVYVTQGIARICDIYTKHGVELDYRMLDDEWFERVGNRSKVEPRKPGHIGIKPKAGLLDRWLGEVDEGPALDAQQYRVDGTGHGKKIPKTKESDDTRVVDRNNMVIVVPPGWLQFRGRDYWQVYKARKRGARTAYASGWCAFGRRGDMDLDSQFPLSDHADFEDILDFVAGCSPGKVYTVNGSTEELAKEIKRELGIDSEPLN